MANLSQNKLANTIMTNESELLSGWVKGQMAKGGFSNDLISESELRKQSQYFMKLLLTAIQKGNLNNLRGSEWEEIREFLTQFSHGQALQGFSPTETATFILSFKEVLFKILFEETRKSKEDPTDIIWMITGLLDELGLFTFEVFQRSREEVIARQQQDMLELSTPVIKIWDGILALPMIGTLDSTRTQVVMESLLQKIVETGSDIAIIDITGVPTVDTLVAQHLLKTVAAARLMGAECIISGVRPQIAQTMVHLAIDLSDVITKSSLADALKRAIVKREENQYQTHYILADKMANQGMRPPRGHFSHSSHRVNPLHPQHPF